MSMVGQPYPQILEWKLRRPWVRPGIVSRTALVDRLLASHHVPVVCVVAPAGYGKTTLLSQWAEQRGRVAWVSEHVVRAARLRPLLTYALPVVSVQTLLELARAYLALADPDGARAVLRQVSDILQQRPDLGVLPEEADELRAKVETIGRQGVGGSSLTTAELRILPLLATHLTFPEIAERLYLSPYTVKTQALSVYRKFGVSSRSAAIEHALGVGVLGHRSSSVATRTRGHGSTSIMTSAGGQRPLVGVVLDTADLAGLHGQPAPVSGRSSASAYLRSTPATTSNHGVGSMPSSAARMAWGRISASKKPNSRRFSVAPSPSPVGT